MNAIREARIALERDMGPWLDDDSRRQNMVFELLHLSPMPPDMNLEALPVAAPQQAVRNEALDSIEKALLNIGAAEDDPTPTKPKTKA